MKNEKKLKKYNLRYEYLVLELQEVQEQMVEYKTQFNLYIVDLEQQHSISIFDRTSIDKPCVDKTKTDENDNIIVNKKKDRKQDQLFKDLYGQIVRVTHPDKTGDDDDMSRVFRHATKAKNEDDLMSMMKICDDLNIAIPELNEDHIATIEKNIKKVQEKINSIKKSDAYVWGEADDKMRKKIETNILKVYKK